MFHVKQFSPHILLVNPWIYDFAAFNLWSRPLGLLEIGGVLRDAGIHVSLIDCVDAENFSIFAPYKPKVSPYGAGKLKRTPIEKPEILSSVPRRYCRYGITPEEFRRHLKELPRPDLVLVSSVMTYWYPGVEEAINLLREQLPHTPIWLGGVYATLIPRHALTVCRPDRVIEGPFTHQHLNDILSLVGRPKKFQPLQSELIGLPFWEGYRIHRFLCIRSSSGCPFHCQYCASNLLNPEFIERPVGQLVDEIIREHLQFGVRDFAFYDDALLVNARARFVPLLRQILSYDLSLRFHTPNGIHIKFITEEIAGLMRQAGFSTLRLSLETTQAKWLARLGYKTTMDEFDHALSCLFDAGFTDKEIKVYLMVGLPGQTLEDVEQSFKDVLKRGVRPSLAEYSPIPGTALWGEACRNSTYPLEEEPLTHNNSLLPCGGKEITKASLDRLKHMIRVENLSYTFENGATESEFLL